MSKLEAAETFLLSGILHDAVANVIFKVKSMDDADLDYFLEYFITPMPETKYPPEIKAKIIELVWTVKNARIT